MSKTHPLSNVDPEVRTAAIDIKIAAMMNLLIDKGIVTEKEVITYTQATKDIFVNQLDPNNPNTEKDKAFFEEFFKDYKF